MIAGLCASVITALARLVTGVRGEWRGCEPGSRARIYFANHNSHLDFVLIWSVLPGALRQVTRPVAGADYWLKGQARRLIIERVFNAVLIDRTAASQEHNPVTRMIAALDEGASLILFPEGTRNMTEARLLPFKSGLYHLAKARPDVELVPVWIENLNRVMPKGEIVPIPLLCTVTFGAGMQLAEGEDKVGFLERARAALLAIAPERGDRS
ncbi:MAG: 1-acyl-sn-glycerol-3-phosphate acyltransferase [Xanthobacteraceae bacterium]|nr:1-acyl-sn-glycerol-3-phosphate acyltransferase [Xanthobacteraceae bacterium]